MNIDSKRIFYKTNQRAFAHDQLKILPKDVGRGVIPFAWNKAQIILNRVADNQLKTKGKVRIVLVKGRQMGLSTAATSRGYWKTSFNAGVKAYIMAHEKAATDNLYEMVKRYYENVESQFRPSTRRSNQKELYFGDIDSRFSLGTAGNKNSGRSSTIHYLLASEVAYWGDNASNIASGLFETVGEGGGTEIIIESTAAGLSNYFGQQILKAQSGESGFEIVFVPWWMMPEYSVEIDRSFKPDDYDKFLMQSYNLSLEQVAWRKIKISRYATSGNDVDPELRFKYEYPLTISEALEYSDARSLISGEEINYSRKRESNPSDWIILGVDPARDGADSTLITARRGDVAYIYPKVGKLKKSTETMLANVIISIIKEEGRKVIGINIDVTGGYGAGTYDILVDLRYGELVHAISFSGKAFNNKEYVNIRAEMYFKLKKAIVNGNLQIPDSDMLAVELAAIEELPNANGRKRLQRKDDIKKKLGRSPDRSDSLALTYAKPYVNTEIANRKETSQYEDMITPDAFG